MADESKEPESRRVSCGTVTGEMRIVVVPIQASAEGPDPTESAPDSSDLKLAGGDGERGSEPPITR